MKEVDKLYDSVDESLELDPVTTYKVLLDVLANENIPEGLSKSANEDLITFKNKILEYVAS